MLSGDGFFGVLPSTHMNDKRQKFIAAYLGPARLNATEAARIAGYKTPRQEGSRLLSNADIQGEIQAWRDEIKRQGIADQTFRIERLNDLDRRYWDLIEARASEYVNVPGGVTGLIVRQFRPDGDGGFLTEYVADVAVTREIRELQKQMAQELGEWTEKRSITGELTFADLAALADEADAESGAVDSATVPS